MDKVPFAPDIGGFYLGMLGSRGNLGIGMYGLLVNSAGEMYIMHNRAGISIIFKRPKEGGYEAGPGGRRRLAAPLLMQNKLYTAHTLL
jgi:hypothetical protein